MTEEYDDLCDDFLAGTPTKEERAGPCAEGFAADLAPIELAFARMKAALRRLNGRG